MSDIVEVVICLGSSCFARGNKNTLRVIDKFIKDNNLQSRVHFHGGHCFGDCANGPILKVNEQIYTHVDENKALEILRNVFENVK
ncbi:MAG TPA: (2Fe-2S) ferredoxin domain-containing protein [Tenuifilaceae bacterium]|nr:(2Fe-2S) ferredoxin domain-containing protein [Tenuifilaceae bacterium]HQB79093.1 (2Fe-2S) ferredoxin domain-containing protein [Tenuifilaceae bacterium]